MARGRAKEPTSKQACATAKSRLAEKSKDGLDGLETPPSTSKATGSKSAVNIKDTHEAIAVKLNAFTTKLKEAKQAFQLSEAPTTLPGREKEAAQLAQFFETAVSSMMGRTLYISGVPGTGKSACVLRALSAFKNRKNVVSAYINAMKLTKAQNVFGEIWEKLNTGSAGKLFAQKHKNPADCVSSYFTDCAAAVGKVHILVIDEIDQLVTRSQSVFYQLFDLAHIQQAPVIVVAISNTMDLPDRLMPRVASRIGITRINFMPYDRSQLFEIVKERLSRHSFSDLFSDDGVQLVSRRLGNGSGDVRKALQICARAIEIRETSLESKRHEILETGASAEAKLLGPISVADMNDAYHDLYANPMYAYVCSESFLGRVLLLSLVLELRANQSTAASMRDIWFRVSCIANDTFVPKGQTKRFTFSDLMRTCDRLCSSGLIRMSRVTASSRRAIGINLDDEVSFEEGEAELPRVAHMDGSPKVVMPDEDGLSGPDYPSKKQKTEDGNAKPATPKRKRGSKKAAVLADQAPPSQPFGSGGVSSALAEEDDFFGDVLLHLSESLNHEELSKVLVDEAQDAVAQRLLVARDC